MSQNNFDQQCPSGNIMVDGFKEKELPEFKCEGCEEYFENEDDLQEHNNMYLCEGCINNAIEEADCLAQCGADDAADDKLHAIRNGDYDEF